MIGSWRFVGTDKGTPTLCSSAFLFTDTTLTVTTPPGIVAANGSVDSMAVHYVPSPTMVSVLTNAPGHVDYNLPDSSHMFVEDAGGKCFYERAG